MTRVTTDIDNIERQDSFSQKHPITIRVSGSNISLSVEETRELIRELKIAIEFTIASGVNDG